jgi:hypothetical protein
MNMHYIFTESEKIIIRTDMIIWLYHNERWALKVWRKSTIRTVLLCGFSAGMGVTCHHAHSSRSPQTHLLFLQLLKTRVCLVSHISPGFFRSIICIKPLSQGNKKQYSWAEACCKLVCTAFVCGEPVQWDASV